jgi:ABC-2 type transport system permease protein
MKSLLAVTRVEFKLFLRNFFAVFFAFAFPVAMLLLYGSIYGGNQPSEFTGGFGLVDYSMPAYACMVIAVTALMSLPLTVAGYRERKVLKRLMASPMAPSKLLASQVVVNFVMTAAGIGLLIAVGVIVYDIHFIGRLLPILFAFTLTTLSMFSIGLLVAGVLPSAKAVNLVSYLLYFPMIFLSGATIPLKVMPEGVQAVARALPMTYGVELMQAAWLGNPLGNYTMDMIVLGGVFVVCAGLAAALFRWE